MANKKVLHAVGIDLGYSHTKFTRRRAQEEGKQDLQCGSFPSLAPNVFGDRLKFAGEKALDGVEVGIDGQTYFVGANVSNYMTSDMPRLVPKNFPATAEYRALLHGALWHVARDALEVRPDAHAIVIKKLVAGLPLNTYNDSHDLVAAMTVGEWELPPLPGRTKPTLVEVNSSIVLPQPHGSMISYFNASNQRTLDNVVVVDMGGGTTDWYCWENGNPNYRKSSAYAKGMLACCFAICDRLEPGLRDDPSMVERVDKALRKNDDSIRWRGENVPLAKHMVAVDNILAVTINKMLESLGAHGNVDHFVICGGGGRVFAASFRRLFPELASRIIEIDEDPVFYNVKGFLLQGEIQHI